MGMVDEARAAGYTEDEIQAHLAPKVAEAQAAGFSPEEIAQHLGVRQVDVAAANGALAARVHGEIAKAQEGGGRKTALEQMGQTVKDAATVYAPIEAALNVATGAALGFPAYLVGGIGGLIARHTYSPDTDPKEIAKLFAETMTYDPKTDAGQRFTHNLTYPLRTLMEFSEAGGQKVADKTDSPVLAAITEATIQMLPAFLIPAFGRALKGKAPTESDMHTTAQELAPDAAPAVTKELAGKVQDTYEKTGIDPETLKNEAVQNPVVMADLASTNKTPFTEGEKPAEPAAPKPPEQGEAQAAVLARVSVGEVTKEGHSLSKFYTAVKDDLYPIAEIEKALADGKDLATAESPYELARLVRGAAGKATQFLDYGAFDWSTYKNTGPGLKQILEPHKNDLDGFRAYAVAARAVELNKRGIETGVPLDAAKTTVAEGGKYAEAFGKLQDYQNSLVKYLRDSGVISGDAYAAMLDANQDYVPFHRVIEGGQAGAGAGLRVRNPVKGIKGSERIIVDPLESVIKNTYLYTALAERNAVGQTFGRLAAKNPDAAAALGIERVKQTMRPIELDEREIRKLFEAFVTTKEKTSTKTTSTTTGGGEAGADPVNKIFATNKARVKDALTSRGFTENEAEIMMKRLGNPNAKEGASVDTLVKEVTTTEHVPELDIRLPHDAALIFRPNAMRPAPNQIRYFEDGKPITLELPADVAEAFNATDRQTAGMLVRILAVPAKTLRAGSVLAPDFMLRNVVRDQLTAYTFSKNGYIPVWDMVSGALSIAKKDVAFQDWLKSGGANAAMVSMDRAYLQQHLLELDKQTGLASRAWNAAKSPLEVLRIASEFMENATRMGEFKRAMVDESGKAAIQDAGFQSREVTLDFQRIGASTRSLNMIAAFMNAGVEGMDRTARAFKDEPIGTTAKVGVGITLPSVLLWAANHDDPRYKEIPQWERDLFWIVMTNDHVYRIPKPFEVGVIFGSLPERMLDKFVADDPEGLKHFSSSLIQAFGVNVLPTGAVPPIEQAANYSFFTGNPLVPHRLEGILPEYQYHEYTTQLSQAVGRMVGAFPGLHDKSIASPVVIDNYIRGWTGSLGAYTTQLLDAGLRKAGVLPDPPQPLATLADIPVVKAFVVRYPAATAQSVQDFYEKYNDRKKVYDTFQYLVKNGDPDAAIKEAELEPAAFARMQGMSETLGVLNANIRLVHKNPDMTPSDKRQLIDSMYGQMIEVARAGNEAMAAVDKVLK